MNMFGEIHNSSCPSDSPPPPHSNIPLYTQYSYPQALMSQVRHCKIQKKKLIERERQRGRERDGGIRIERKKKRDGDIVRGIEAEG